MNKPTLRDDWRNFRKFLSIKAIALASALQLAWPQIPDDMKATLPPHMVQYITLALLAVVVYGVMTKQEGLKDEQK